MRLWFLILLLSSLTIGDLPCQSVEKVKSVNGDKGQWTVQWHGSGIKIDGRVLPRAGATLGRAIREAEKKNWKSFTSLFETNTAVDELTSFYQEWGHTSQCFTYILGAEGNFTNRLTGDVRSVLSFVPWRSRNCIPASLPTNEPGAIFAKLVGTEWKLVTGIFDSKVHTHLVEQVRPFLFRANSLNGASQKEAHQTTAHAKEPTVLAQEAHARQISNEIQAKGVSLRTWADWTNCFKVTILDPPVFFDAAEPTKDFGNPVAALKSHLHAVLVGDAETLLLHADETGRQWLKQAMRVDSAKPVHSYRGSMTNFTHTTVLMTADRFVGGKYYTLLLTREQDRLTPKEKMAALQVRIFKKQNGEYLFSRDLALSHFTFPLGYARADNVNAEKYPKFLDGMKTSQLPPHFYTIE